MASDPQPPSAPQPAPTHPAATQPRDDVGRWTPRDGPALQQISFLDAKEPYDDALLADRMHRFEVSQSTGGEAPPAPDAPAVPAQPDSAAEESSEPPQEEPSAEGEFPSASSADAPTVDTIEALAEALGVDVPTLSGQLTVAGPGGERIPLARILESFEKTPAILEGTTKLEARARELDTREAQLRHLHDQRLAQLQLVIEQSYQDLKGAEESVDWERLKAEDPMGYTLRRQELIDREFRLRRQMEIRDVEKADRERATQEQKRSVIASEQAKLFEVRPEWREPEKGLAVKHRLEATIRQIGLDPGIFEQVPDHRLVLLVELAGRQLEFERTKKPLAMARLKNLPKPAPPQARPTQVDDSVRRRSEVFARHRRERSIESAAAAIRETL